MIFYFCKPHCTHTVGQPWMGPHAVRLQRRLFFLMIVSPALNDIELVLLCGVYKGISMVKLCGLSCKRAILVNRTVPVTAG